ncbi:hypothetical protein, partial [Pseudomonas sp. SIMBA_021]|uniref:hypothetical protein n=1 Tax=Pseudomonas sp. SIMBA_021 TaxID=3085767 RepID=UPI00397CAC8C
EHCNVQRTRAVDKRRAMQFGPLRNAASLSAALQALATLDRLRVVKEGKKAVIHLNPALINGGA